MKPAPKTSADKDLGVVFTPERITRFLSRWAIRSPHDVTLDPGAGNGQFLIAAGKRLAELRATPDQLPNQLHAVEYSEERFRHLSENASTALGYSLPHLYRADLFGVEFPPIDAVIGNPPYVIRHRLSDAF